MHVPSWLSTFLHGASDLVVREDRFESLAVERAVRQARKREAQRQVCVANLGLLAAETLAHDGRLCLDDHQCTQDSERTLIVVEWRDILFPSSWIRRRLELNGERRALRLDGDALEELRSTVLVANEFLSVASQVGTVVIVSKSMAHVRREMQNLQRMFGVDFNCFCLSGELLGRWFDRVIEVGTSLPVRKVSNAMGSTRCQHSQITMLVSPTLSALTYQVKILTAFLPDMVEYQGQCDISFEVDHLTLRRKLDSIKK